MADVDMTDVPSGSTAIARKVAGKPKTGASADSGADGKKRFEVKKVCPARSCFQLETAR